jgi:hypothetical protein
LKYSIQLYNYTIRENNNFTINNQSNMNPHNYLTIITQHTIMRQHICEDKHQELLPEQLFAEYLLTPVLEQNNSLYIINYHDIYHDRITITQQETINAILYIIDLYPNIKAWINLKHLQFVLCLEWFQLLEILLDIIEKRNLYFTPSGIYYNLSRTCINVYQDTQHYRCNRHDVPLEHTEGQYNIPYYLVSLDNYASTINNDTTILYILHKYNNDTNIYNLCKRFSANTSQWLIQECEAFHRSEQYNTIGMICHTTTNDENKNDDDYYYNKLKCHTWHTKLTKDKCKLCNLSTKPKNKYLFNTNTNTSSNRYEQFIYDTMMLRRKRLYGILYCASVLIGKARLIKYKPGIGSKYFEAMAHFQHSRNQR